MSESKNIYELEMQKFRIEFGKRVLNKRIQLGMTQEQLADALGYTADHRRSTISKIEKGQQDVDASRLPILARALNTTIGFLMGWEEEGSMPECVFAPNEIDLVMSYRKADPKDRRTVEYILDEYKEDMPLSAEL